MKKLTTGFLALTLLAGTSFAFTTANANAEMNAKKTPFVWYQTISDTDPTPDLNSQRFTSQAAASTTLGCSSGSHYCAAQVDEADNSTTGLTIPKP